MKTETAVQPSCETCLYRATHEKQCTDCLTDPEYYAEHRRTGHYPPYHFRNYREGNWVKRRLQHELEGRCNIVIGGQGEAEVNTKGDPHKTAKHLHYVAEACGYLAGNLRQKDGQYLQKISTSEGTFQLVWDTKGLLRIEAWSCAFDPDKDEYIDTKHDDQWNRQQCQEWIAGLAD